MPLRWWTCLWCVHRPFSSDIITQPSGKLARWGMAIQELDLQIHHRKRTANSNAHALLRFSLPINSTSPLYYWDSCCGSYPGVDNLAASQRKNEDMSHVITYLDNGVFSTDEKLANTQALTQSQVHCPRKHPLSCGARQIPQGNPPNDRLEELFWTAHEGACMSDVKVHSQHYWWDRMRANISRRTKGCLLCGTHSPGCAIWPLLTPIPVAGPLWCVGVDVLQLPCSYSENCYPLFFMDYLMKRPEVFAIVDQTSATIAKILVEKIMSRHGVPAEILSDRGRTFYLVSWKKQILLGFHKFKTNSTNSHPDRWSGWKI